MKKKGAGRPPETDANDLADKLLNYIAVKCKPESCEVPILAEFACQHDILRERIYQLAETKDGERLSYAIKKCSQAKEYRLEKLGLAGKINSGICAFSLKQLGWRENKAELPADPESLQAALNKIADAMLPK